MGIPDTKYSSIICLNSGEFTRICKELSTLSETVIIETNKNFVKFIVSSEIVGGSIKLESNDSDDKDEISSIKVENFLKNNYLLLIFFLMIKT